VKLFILNILIFITPGLMSYSCDGVKHSPESNIPSTQYIFSGRVVGLEEVKEKDGGYKLKAQIEVESYWKSKVPRKTYVLTGVGGMDCGYPFVFRERYIVFAYRDGDFFKTNIFSGTTSVYPLNEQSDRLVELLGKPIMEYK
jgi:hypothetical protein